MPNTIETSSETESIRADIKRVREKLAELNRRRGELALRARTNPDMAHALEQVRLGIQSTEAELGELELALEASVQRDQKTTQARREEIIRELGETFDSLEAERREAVTRARETRDPDAEQRVAVLNLQTYDLGHRLCSLLPEGTPRRNRYAVPWRDLHDLLGRQRGYFEKPKVELPWEGLLEELRQIDAAKTD